MNFMCFIYGKQIWNPLYYRYYSTADFLLDGILKGETMGRFLNPDNSSFQDVINSEIYVDKTGLLDYTNSVINTTSKFICNSRPRRFGKSITADMMAAYYSMGFERTVYGI